MDSKESPIRWGFLPQSVVVCVKGESLVGFAVPGGRVDLAKGGIGAVSDDLSKTQTGICLVFVLVPDPRNDFVSSKDLTFGELAVLSIDLLLVVFGQ